MQLNKQNLITALGSNLLSIKGDFIVENYSIDTRTLKVGDCFIALKDKTDGHQYLSNAIEKGALSLLITEEFFSQNPINFPNLIIVKDTYLALKEIAEFTANTLKKNGGELIGITGSVGKTTLKEMLQFVLSQNNKVSSTLGNFNNHIGLPFSLAHLKADSDFGVFEMGMSSVGEISFLVNILKPRIAVITEIAAAHTEFFNSSDKSPLDLIAEAKSEIIEGLNEKSVLFLNFDNQYFNFLKEKAQNKGVKEIITFSQNNPSADIYVKTTNLQNNYYTEVSASIFGMEVSYKINSMALHNAMLSALALGIARKLNIDIKKTLENFGDFKIPKGRGAISKINFDDKNITLIDDSYNASPKSMNSAILSLSSVSSKKVIILGDMLELGESKEKEHIALKDSLQKVNNIKEVILIGKLMQNLYNEANDSIKMQHFNNFEESLSYIKNILDDGDLVFIKGSLGSGVINISKYLQSNMNNL